MVVSINWSLSDLIILLPGQANIFKIDGFDGASCQVSHLFYLGIVYTARK